VDVTLRRAVPQDVQTLVQMRRAFKTEDEEVGHDGDPEFERACITFLAEATSNNDWHVWLAEVDGDIVAHAFLRFVEKIPSPFLAHGRIAYCTNVYAKPSFRSQGIGSQLIKRVQRDACEGGAELVFLWPSEASLGFYKRLGFESPGEPLIWQTGLD
jgi:GNAT superfamily N-acetyltransferase